MTGPAFQKEPPSQLSPQSSTSRFDQLPYTQHLGMMEKVKGHHQQLNQTVEKLDDLIEGVL
jgi:hypothetical protein